MVTFAWFLTYTVYVKGKHGRHGGSLALSLRAWLRIEEFCVPQRQQEGQSGDWQGRQGLREMEAHD